MIKKTLCVDARLITAPGIGTYLKNIFSHLRNAPWKWYALIHTENAGRLSPWPHIEPIFLSSSIYSVKEQWELPFKIPQVDLFWSPHYNVPLLPIRSRKRLSCIHDVFHLAFASTLRFIEKTYAKYMLRAALSLSDGIITCSDFSKKEIQTYTKIDHPLLQVIAYGVDRGVFYPSDICADFLTKYGIKQPFILYVGSLKTHKNLKGLVAAFSLIQKDFPDLQLVIVGAGKNMRYCEDVKQLYILHPEWIERLHCIGAVSDEDLPHFYRAAKAFVFPSFYEGFGFPPLEAMSCGCPTIVAQTGALPETCEDAVVYVDPHNPSQMAEQLQRVLQENDLRSALSQKGIERSQRFCWKECAEKHLSFIERLIT